MEHWYIIKSVYAPDVWRLPGFVCQELKFLGETDDIQVAEEKFNYYAHKDSSKWPFSWRFYYLARSFVGMGMRNTKGFVNPYGLKIISFRYAAPDFSKAISPKAQKSLDRTAIREEGKRIRAYIDNGRLNFMRFNRARWFVQKAYAHHLSK